MARVSASVDPSQIPPGAAALIDRIPTQAGTNARLAGQQRPASPATLDQWAAATRAAALAWDNLGWWKRFRWSLCAWRHADPTQPPAPAPGDSGWRLYLACYLGQGVIAPRQPISPCARRIWDSGASAWDYTP